MLRAGGRGGKMKVWRQESLNLSEEYSSGVSPVGENEGGKRGLICERKRQSLLNLACGEE